MEQDRLRLWLADQRMNLSLLARLSGVPLRTLRRIKNTDCAILSTTMERIEPHVKKALQ